MDLSPTLTPKSNQLNADDLIAGPKTITITKVSPSGNEQQPVAIYFEGDNGKPFLPCKSMRRVMVSAWGQDGASYIGRRLTLFRDPEVLYGGIQVGGIRISHMSHIQQDLSIALTITRSKRAPYKVRKLEATAAAQQGVAPPAVAPAEQAHSPEPERRTAPAPPHQWQPATRANERRPVAPVQPPASAEPTRRKP